MPINGRGPAHIIGGGDQGLPASALQEPIGGLGVLPYLPRE